METTVLTPEFSRTLIASAMMDDTDAITRFGSFGLMDTLKAAKTPLDDEEENEDDDDDELVDDDEDDVEDEDLEEDDDLEDEDDDEDGDEDEDDEVEDDDDPKPLRVKTRM